MLFRSLANRAFLIKMGLVQVAGLNAAWFHGRDSLVLLELRVWGFASELPVKPLARLSLSVTLCGFGLVVTSGLLMFAANPAELLSNRAFLIKMGLVQLAGLNAAWFHGRGSLTRGDALARVQTVLSMGIWFAAIICGRWIAYL